VGPGSVKIQEAGLPFHILRATTGREIAPSEFFEEIRNAQAVCVGENHDNEHDHWAQLEILKVIAKDGGAFGTGMEMFQRPFQGVLDDFREGKISEESMLARTDWKRRWTYDWNFYAPMVRLTVERGGSVIALNISRELKEKWKKRGVEGLSAADRAKIPQLDLEDEQHRSWFRNLMEQMGETGGTHGTGDNKAEEGGKKNTELPASAEKTPVHAKEAGAGDTEDITTPKDGDASSSDEDLATVDKGEESGESEDFIDKIYPVQVLWDETMADTAATWLLAQSDRRMVIIAGHGHCHESAIIRRMRRRGISSVISVRPVVDTGHGEVADLLTAPVNTFLLVMEKLGKKK